MIKIPETNSDYVWLNRVVTMHLSEQTFTPEQEEAIKKLIFEIAYGYRRTISRMEWGPGWD